VRRPWLFLAALNGLLAVGLGAFAAHGLSHDAYAAGLVDKASRYQMYHGLALLGVAWLAEARPSRLVSAAGASFLLGVVLFCGALYAIGLAGVKAGAAAPFGGAAFMSGWLLLAVTAIRR
jgi:uncharacterized membrane protein YgdD (TMEM256/DUF423 family)